ncbi:MAG: PAS domain S-box protein [Anaerolineae bacterium]|nr:PAS domain S-box protein [Anaerolineae bacterium]
MTEQSNILHQVLDGLIEGVAIVDPGGRLIHANRPLETMLGYDHGELAGSAWRALLSNGDRWQAGDWQPGYRDTRLRHKDGHPVPVLVAGRPLGEGQQGILTTIVKQETSAGNGEQARRVARAAAVSQQASSVAHEVYNALTIVGLQSQVLARNPELSPTCRHGLGIIHEQVVQMKDLLNELLRPGQVHGLHLVPVNLDDLIRCIVALLGDDMIAAGVRVVTHLDGALPPLWADRHKLQQLLVNLLNNARQAVASTGRPGTLTITTQRAGSDRVQVRVADDGPGIPADMLDQVFEPFFTTKAPAQGTGLGLTICRDIVQRHGGKIWAEANPAGGATFVVELPLGEAQALEG